MKVRVMKPWALLSLLLLLCIPVSAQTNQAPISFQETTLKNALRVITVEDRSTSVVALSVTYNVGSRDEQKGRTGFAHLFEHMMFQGSANVGKGEHAYQIFNNGGAMNGSTNEDQTNYFAVVPSNQLDLILFLESDRMRSLDITQANLDNQREAVKEERRLRLDNQPYGRSNEVMQELIYDNFAYKHSVIGSMADLDAATVRDVSEFFKRYYAPNNAVMVLVGNFDRAEALAKIRRAFEDIPRQPDPPAVDMKEPQQSAERRASVDDPLARLARLDIAFKTVSGNVKDYYALRMLSSVLQSNQSSRLHQKLVKDKELLLGIGGGLPARRGTGAFYISATWKSGQKPAEIETAIYEELERLKKEPISAAEMEKARRIQERALTFSRASSLAIAVTLSSDAVNFGDPNLINTRKEAYNSITAEDVQRVANKYFTQDNRTVVVTLPAKKAPAMQKSAGREGIQE